MPTRHHDQVEAMTMGDRVAVLSRGSLQQVDTPQNLYDNPDNLFVAAFIGSPQMNLMHGELHLADGSEASLTLGSQHLRLPASVFAARPALRGYDGREVAVGIRPAGLEDATLTGDAPCALRGKVFVREGLGSEVLLHLALDAKRVMAPGEEKTEAAWHFVARVDPRTKVQVDDEVVLAVDTDIMHFFDLETGLAIRK